MMNIVSGIESISSSSISTSQLAEAHEQDFGSWIDSQIRELNSQSAESADAVKKVISGDIQNIHQVIMQIEKTQRSFQMAVQVRDRLLEGYQEVMRMQI